MTWFNRPMNAILWTALNNEAIRYEVLFDIFGEGYQKAMHRAFLIGKQEDFYRARGANLTADLCFKHSREESIYTDEDMTHMIGTPGIV